MKTTSRLAWLGVFALLAVACNGETALTITRASDGLSEARQPSEVRAALARCSVDGSACRREGTALDVCWSDQLQCAAQAFEIELPPTSRPATSCLDAALACAHDAQSQTEVVGCGDELSRCALAQLTAAEAAKPLERAVKCSSTRDDCSAQPQDGSCQQQWIACFGGDFFRLFQCAGTLADCKD